MTPASEKFKRAPFMPWSREQLTELMKRKPVMLAPMEDVSDVVFRRISRGFGAG